MTMDRDELLRREQASWDAFLAAVTRVPPERREQEGVVPGWSVKDLVWHCGFWADDSADRLEVIASSGAAPPDRLEPVWQAMNDRAAEDAKAMSWEVALERTEAARRRIRAALSEMPESDLAASEFAEETFEHYDEHAAEVERFASSGDA